MSFRAKQNYQNRRAFILPAALLLLVISCSALGLAAYNSGRIALLANSRECDLKRNWSSKTLVNVILSQADSILLKHTLSDASESERAADEAQGYCYGETDLNGLKFQWLLRDEQAVANINSLVATKDLRGLMEATRRLTELDMIAEGKGAELILPIKKTDKKSFDNIFIYDNQPDKLFTVDKNPKGAALRIGCWGDGKLNILRADRKTLESVLAGRMDLNTIVTLINIRREMQRPDDNAEAGDTQNGQVENVGTISLSELLKILELDDKQRESVSELACTKSSTFSLTLQDADGYGNWRRMYILDSSETGSTSTATAETGLENTTQSEGADKSTQVFQW